MMALGKNLQIRSINNLPCEISEAKSDTSERIFAISTAAVTRAGNLQKRYQSTRKAHYKIFTGSTDAQFSYDEDLLFFFFLLEANS
jgi:hypothetical protein